MKKLSILSIILASALLLSFNGHGQVITGVFGGDAAASGYVNHGNTHNKWIKLGEMTLNGAYNAAGMTVDFYPGNSNHGDSRQRVNVQMRNHPSGGLYQSTWDVSLVHLSGQHFTVRDVKAVHTSGSGVTNNKISIWVQMGNSWMINIPIEVRTYGNCTVQTTNQPYYSTIQDAGTVYDRNTYFAIRGDLLEMDGTIKGEKVIADPDAWPDYVFEEEYDLKSLEEVENFIKANGHLPNIAPADTFLTNGVSLGDMDVKLLEKIEELTLYTIDQEKKIEEQTTKVNKQNALIEELLQRVAKLENQ